MKNNKLKLGLTVLGLFLMQAAFGQSLEDINAANESYESFNISLATVLYIFAIILVAIAGGMMLIAVHLKRYLKGELGEEYAKKQPFWEKVFQIKPVASDKDTVINHPHDGIYELDNPPPPWFMFLFYGTMVFAVIYYIRFTFTESGYTQAEEYETEMKMAEEDHAKFLKTAGEVIDESNVVLLTDAADLEKGATIFKANCVACHGDYGQGISGPNLTDQYWKYGGDIKDVFETVKYGRPGGMQSWKQFGAKGMQAVASYVVSLEGSKIPAGVTPKDAEGDFYDRNAATKEGEATTEEAVKDSTATETVE